MKPLPLGMGRSHTVSLASYHDLFPTLAVQQGQTTLLNNPSQIEVYVDNNPQKAQHASTRSAARYALTGWSSMTTARCAWIAEVNDGVTTTPQPSSGVAAQSSRQAVCHDSGGPVLQTVTTTK